MSIISKTFSFLLLCLFPLLPLSLLVSCPTGGTAWFPWTRHRTIVPSSAPEANRANRPWLAYLLLTNPTNDGDRIPLLRASTERNLLFHRQFILLHTAPDQSLRRPCPLHQKPLGNLVTLDCGNEQKKKKNKIMWFINVTCGCVTIFLMPLNFSLFIYFRRYVEGKRTNEIPLVPVQKSYTQVC